MPTKRAQVGLLALALGAGCGDKGEEVAADTSASAADTAVTAGTDAETTPPGGDPDPFCGDGAVDPGEACDDGNGLGGDGCWPDCTLDPGPYEAEPNDEPALAPPGEGALSGSLADFDVDCVAVDVPGGGWLEATLGTPQTPCTGAVLLRLGDPDGEDHVVAFPDEETNCSVIDPMAGARYLEAGRYTLCVEGLFGAPVPAYRLVWSVGEDSCAIPGLIPGPEEDLDGDGLANDCDDDRDGDGRDNEQDNCPDVSNGPETPELAPDSEGWIRSWLHLGPVEGLDGVCAPPTEAILGDPATAVPSLGDAVGDLQWVAYLGRESLLNYHTLWPTFPAAREVFAVSYVFSESRRAVDFSFGPDDGGRAWLNGALVAEVLTCQGASKDRVLVPVTLEAGWNRLLVRTHDSGGGWGAYVRFRSGGVGVSDLTLALDPGGDTTPGQGDRDGDGVGDVCDPTPGG